MPATPMQVHIHDAPPVSASVRATPLRGEVLGAALHPQAPSTSQGGDGRGSRHASLTLALAVGGNQAQAALEAAQVIRALVKCGTWQVAG